MISGKRLYVIISDYRHGTTTLCDVAAKTDGVGCLYEAFNNNGLLYGINTGVDFINQIDNRISSTTWLNDKNIIVLKVFKRDWKYLKEMINTNIIDHAIFLRRRVSDSYNSYIRAMTTGDWAGNPDTRARGLGITEYKVPVERVESYKHYKKSIHNWFTASSRLLINAGLPFHEIWFKEIISPEFKFTDIIYS